MQGGASFPPNGHVIQAVLDENARLIVEWIALREVSEVDATATTHGESVRRVQLRLTENIDFLANLANQSGRRGASLDVVLPPRFAALSESAARSVKEVTVAQTKRATAAAAAMPDATRWTAFVDAAAIIAPAKGGAVRRLIEGAIEELRTRSGDDEQQGALIEHLERALSSVVYAPAAAGGAQKMAAAVARDWRAAAFPGDYAKFELPSVEAKVIAPPYTTMMMGLSYRRATRERSAEVEGQPQLKMRRTAAGAMTFAVPAPVVAAPVAVPVVAALPPVAAAAAAAPSPAQQNATATASTPFVASAGNVALQAAVDAVAAAAVGTIPTESDEDEG